jgi:rod shape-determining protein MreD
LRRALTTAAVIVVAVVLQVTLVNRLPLPYGAVPSLVLIMVAVTSVTDGPMAGAVTGFCAGLTLDIAPPGSHLVGENALVYCLIGYACGRAGQIKDLAALPAVLIAAAAAAAGEAMSAGLGLMLSDPEVTWTAMRDVLPAAVVYDVLLTPFAFGLVTWLRPAADTDWGRSGARAPRAARGFGGPAPAFGAAAFSGAAFGGAAFNAGRGGTGVRLASGRNSPRLRLAGLASPAIKPGIPRKVPKLKLAGLASPALTPRIPRRDPKLKLTGSGPRHTTAPVGRPVRVAFSSKKSSGAIGGRAGRPVTTRSNARIPKFHQAHGPLSTLAHLLRPRRHSVAPGRGWLKVKPPRKPRAPRSPGKGWLSGGGNRTMRKRRYVAKNWARTSRRRRARSRLGGLR